MYMYIRTSLRALLEVFIRLSLENGSVVSPIRKLLHLCGFHCTNTHIYMYMYTRTQWDGDGSSGKVDVRVRVEGYCKGGGHEN